MNERLKRYVQEWKGTLFVTEDLHKDLHKAVNLIYNHPWRPSAIERLNRSLRLGISKREFAQLVVSLYLDDRLCLINQDTATQQSEIICSLGLFTPMKWYFTTETQRSTEKNWQEIIIVIPVFCVSVVYYNIML